MEREYSLFKPKNSNKTTGAVSPTAVTVSLFHCAKDDLSFAMQISERLKALGKKIQQLPDLVEGAAITKSTSAESSSTGSTCDPDSSASSSSRTEDNTPTSDQMNSMY